MNMIGLLSEIIVVWVLCSINSGLMWHRVQGNSTLIGMYEKAAGFSSCYKAIF